MSHCTVAFSALIDRNQLIESQKTTVVLLPFIGLRIQSRWAQSWLPANTHNESAKRLQHYQKWRVILKTIPFLQKREWYLFPHWTHGSPSSHHIHQWFELLQHSGLAKLCRQAKSLTEPTLQNAHWSIEKVSHWNKKIFYGYGQCQVDPKRLESMNQKTFSSLTTTWCLQPPHMTEGMIQTSRCTMLRTEHDASFYGHQQGAQIGAVELSTRPDSDFVGLL